MYDYAIDKYVPVRFFDYVNEKWSETRPATNIEIQEGDYAPAPGLTFLQIGRAGLNFQKSQNGGVALPGPGAFSDARITGTDHAYRRAIGSNLSSMEWM